MDTSFEWFLVNSNILYLCIQNTLLLIGLYIEINICTQFCFYFLSSIDLIAHNIGIHSKTFCMCGFATDLLTVSANPYLCNY